MEISSPKAQQVINELLELRKRDDYMGKTFEIGKERLTKLFKSGFYLEAFLVDVQVTEHFLKLVLASYATRRRILHLVGEKDIHESVKLEFDDEVPIGGMIGTLKKLGATTSLVRQLSEFNTLRKQAVHHIFDGTSELTDFDEKLKKYIQSDEHEAMMLDIANAHEKVSEEIKGLVKTFS